MANREWRLMRLAVPAGRAAPEWQSTGQHFDNIDAAVARVRQCKSIGDLEYGYEETSVRDGTAVQLVND